MAVRFRLRELLEEAGINQSEASRQSRVSFATINRMCTNATRRVDLEVMSQLCRLLDCEPGALFDYVPDRRGKQ
jgi:putative transcriptional regulator